MGVEGGNDELDSKLTLLLLVELVFFPCGHSMHVEVQMHLPQSTKDHIN
jgi:hypothetical protein